MAASLEEGLMRRSAVPLHHHCLAVQPVSLSISRKAGLVESVVGSNGWTPPH